MTEKQKEFLNLIIYQIYPRSFNDSNNDGIGDIKGIIEKLDHLSELGVNAVWLSPCYKSPNEDGGYDISDYCDIMDELGTLDDWKQMIAEMNKRGIKLIMDYVANHTSSEHRWFKESRKSKDNPYRDYYIWVDEPPTDWQSSFGGSAWQYDETTNQYYLHSFAVGQPDLNWENPRVREEMKKVIDFWIDLGVYGFRCDVLDSISKSFELNLMSNGPRLHEYIKELFGREKTAHVFTVGECWDANENNIELMVAEERNELSTVFQMDHLVVGMDFPDKFVLKPFKLTEVRDILARWQEYMQKKNLLYSLFLENHDSPRVVSKWGNDRELRYESATMLATMCFMHKGIPFLYQGQEIGTANSECKSVSDFRDVETLNYVKLNPKNLTDEEMLFGINHSSRDQARHPMAWTGGLHAGFSDVEAWQPDYSRYKEINVEADKKSDKSVFNYFKNLIALKKGSDCLKYGKYENLSGVRDMYIYKRYTDDEAYIIVCNFEEESVLDMDVPCEVVLSNLGRKKLGGTYTPYECAVFKIK